MSKAAELAALIANVNKGSSLANKNFIINGNMTVAQRATSFSFAHDGTISSYTTDRFAGQIWQNTDELDGTFAQVADAPSGTGLTHSLKWTTGTAETAVASDESLWVEQKIEAQNVRELCYGTADAKPVTLSFWVKSSITGTFNSSLYQADGNRVITNTYSISSANTWEYKTLTFAGDTSGTINDDTGEGLRPYWNIFAGDDYTTTDRTSWGSYSSATWAYGHTQNAHATTSGATFFLTGVQLEVGEKATEFEHESFETTLRKCQRYYEKSYDHDTALAAVTDTGTLYGPGATGNLTTGLLGTTQTYTTSKRASATLVIYDPAGNSGKCLRDNFGVASSANQAIATAYGGTKGFLVYSSGTYNAQTIVYHFTADAEL